MQSASCKKHETLVNILLCIALRKSTVKIDDLCKFAKHAVTDTSDNDGIAEKSANFM